MPLNEYDDLLQQDQAPGSAPAEVHNEYDAVLADDKDSQKRSLSGAMFVASQTTPDRAAKVQDISRRMNLPTNIVDRNFDELTRKDPVAETDYDSLIKNTPALAKFMENPDNAAVAHDDLPALGKVEQDVKDHSMLSTMYQSLTSGMAQLNSSIAHIPALAVDVAALPGNYVSKAIGHPEYQVKSPDWLMNNPVAKHYEAEAQALRTVEMDLSPSGEFAKGNYKRAGMALAVQFAANAPMQAALIASALSGAGIAGLVAAGVTTAADANVKGRESGVDPATSTANALAHGAIESAFESLGTFGILKNWEGVIAKTYGKQVSREVFKDFAKTIGYSFAAEGNEEAMTSIAQDFSDYVTGVNPDGLTGMGQRALDAGLIGAASGGMMTAPSATLAGASRGAKIRESTLARDFYLALGQSAEATKLRQRLPGKQREYVEGLTKDGPVENIFLPLEAVETYFQSAKLNPTAAMQEIGALPQYTEAKETGADIRIPLATWVDKVVGTEHYTGLANDVKFDPNALTVNEQKQEDVKAQAEVEQAAKEAEAASPEVKASVPTIKQTVSDQLKASGMSAQHADTNASILESTFKTLGERTGQDPQALFDRFNLKINGAEQQQAAAGGEQVLNQPRRVEDDLATRKSQNPLPEHVPVFPITTDNSFNGLDSKDIRKLSLSDAKAMPRGNVTNKAEGWEVSVSGEGLKKSANYAVRPEQALGLRNLKALIENAHYVRSEQRGNQAPHDYLYSPFEHNGQDYLAKIVLENLGKRRKFYSLHVQQVERPLERPTIRPPGATDESAAPTPSERTIPLQHLFDQINKARETTEFYQGGDDPRGRIRLGKDGINIDLLKSADPSTFLHEVGHFYLEVMGDLATATEAPEQIKTDYQTILEWMGVTSREEIKAEQHEKWARGFEAYLMEGKAPTEALRQAFARFKVWLTSVYRQLQNLNVELTPQVRDVMNRMMATDEEIRSAEASQNFDPLFGGSPETFGMTGKKAEAYKKATEEARRFAEEKVNAQLMKDHAREQHAWYREQRSQIRGEIAGQVNTMPVYQAMAALANGTHPDGTPRPGAVKLSREALTPAQRKNLPKGVIAEIGAESVHPDIAAESYGFASGEQLLKALIAAQPRDVYIDKLTDDRMAELFPDLLTSGELPEEAMKAVHNEKRSEMLRLELEHLASENMPVLKEVIRRVARRVPTEKAVRDQATNIIGGMAVRDIRPLVYQKAEAKAAKEAGEALTKGDLDKAFEAKRRELLNHELYRAAVAAKETVDSTVKNLKRFFKNDADMAKTRDMDMVNAARAVLAEFGLGQSEKSAIEYLEPIKRYDPDAYATVVALVESATLNVAPYETVAYDDFVAVKDAIEALWSLARSSKQIDIDGRKMELDDVKDELSNALAPLVDGSGSRAGYDRAATTWDKAKMGLMGIRSALRRIESWVTAVDGADKGTFRTYIWNPISEATGRYREAKKEFINKYLSIVKAIEPSLTYEKIEATELGYQFSGKAELLGALLHTGNESNLSKLLRGRGWGVVGVDGTIDATRWTSFLARMHQEGILTKADYDYAQAVWDLNEELKAPAQKAHKEMYGYHFNEVTAQEVATPFGTYRGGYVPAIADPFVAQDAAIRNEREALEKSNNSFMFPTAGRGFTKSRVEAYAAPLAMDLRLVPSHIDKVLRFVHIEPSVKQVGRIVMDKKFRKVLDAFDPTVGGDMLVPWLQRAAQQKVTTSSQGWGGRAADTFFRELRTRSGLQVMFGNVVNTMQQVTGLSIAAVKVKPSYLASALWQFTRQPKVTTETVNEKSDFMRTRCTTNVMEIQQTIDDLMLNPSTYEKARDFAKKHGYFLQSTAQNFVDVVTWAGAYDQSTSQGMTELESVRSADAAVRETQGSMNAEDISRFETGTPFMRAFTMFYSYFNMQANLLGTELFSQNIRKLGLRKGAGRALYVYTLGFVVPAVLSEVLVKGMSGRGLDEDGDDEYLDDAMNLFFGAQFRTATAMFPFVGPAVQAGFNAFNDKWYDDRISTSPAVAMIESAVSAPHSVYNAIAGDGARKKAIRDSLTAIGMLTGIPAAPLSRPLGYLSDVQDGTAQPSGPIDFARGLVTGKAGKP